MITNNNQPNTKYAGGLACVQAYNQFDKQINKLNKSGAQSKSVLLYKGGWVLNILTMRSIP